MAKHTTALAGLTALGVRRPIFIIVINLLIVLAGLASMLGVDVRELPDVDRPVVSVRATYSGASPQTMDTEITSILENAVARVAGVKNIQSSSEENNMRMRVEFNPGVDLNIAASDVREAVNRVQSQLPDDVDTLQVVKADDDAQAVVELSAYSNILSKYELAERIEKDIVPELQSIPGVAEVRLQGDQPRVLRVLLHPEQLAAYNLSVSEVLDALRTINFDVPAGSYTADNQELFVRSFASVVDPEKAAEIFVTKTVQLGDVADIFFAPEKAESYSLLNGRTVVGLGVVRQAGANTIAIAAEVDKRLQQINQRTNDFTLVKISDDAIFIKGSLQEVVSSLLISVAIVLVVIAVFLGQPRATLIPAVTMPVSLIGTVAAVWLCGFSINLLTLLALVLATGLIVDDAIVVLENIQRRRAQGLEKMAAAVLGTRQVFFAVVATTITLVSVFLPIIFLPGETGGLFREFGLVLSIAVIISSFVSVTLCPMMASRLPNLSHKNSYLTLLRQHLNQFGERFTHRYITSLEWFMAQKFFILLLAAGIMAGGVIGFYQLNRVLLPQEDRGAIRVFLTGPDGASLSYTDRQAQQVEEILRPYKEQGLITNIYTIVGRWDKNRAYTVATLKHWNERHISQMALASRISAQLAALPGAQVRVVQSSGLTFGGGNSGGVEVAVLGNNYTDIYTAATQLADALKQGIPEISDATVQFNTSQPELSFTINRQTANDLDVPMARIGETLRVMVDEMDVLDLSINDQSVPLMVGSALGSITEPNDLMNIFVTNTNNQLIPLAALVTMKEQGVAAELDRYEQRRGIAINVGVAPHVPLGNLAARMKDVAAEVLPTNTTLIFLGEAATLEEASYETTLTFALALLVVFLVLAAQFESFGSAFIVMFTVPFGLAAAVFAMLLTGQSLNLYSQIGLVLLIGLITKNAILLVEFMDQLRDEGHPVSTAVVAGVKTRLRPVAMTVFSTVLGALPLVLSTGPGAEARNAIGWVVFGGLGLSTLFTLYFAPLGYALIAPHLKPRAHAGRILAEQLAHAEHIETNKTPEEKTV